MTSPPSLPRKHLSDSPFLKWWLIYFGAIAYGWCALAGVCFILLIAFAGDSGQFDSRYFSTLLEVFMVLFVWPLIVIAVLSALLALIHQGLLKPLWNRFRKQPSTQVSAPVLDITQASSGTRAAPVPQPPSARKSPSGPKAPVFTIITCLTSNLIGTLMVVGNAPRSLQENGLGPTLFTSLVFLIPLVVLPSFFLIRALRCFFTLRSQLRKDQDASPFSEA